MGKKRVFITGGASGLGQALAIRHARAGHRVCIADLDEARCKDTLAALRAAGDTEGFAVACDVRKETDLEAAAERLVREWGGVDVVYNNAGVAQAGAIGDVSLADWQWIVDINLLGVVRGCKVFAPIMKRQRSGHIVNTASMAGLIHIPRAAAYNATKAAVVALSETIKLELEPDNVNVSVVCPAFFKTNLTSSLRATEPGLEDLVRALVDRSKISADSIAELVFRGVERGDFHILTHTDSKVIWMLKRLAYPLYLAAMRRGIKANAAKSEKVKNKTQRAAEAAPQAG